MTAWMSMPSPRRLSAVLGLCLSLAACGTPVSVEHVDARTVQTELTSNVLTTGQLSGPTQIVLRQLDLLQTYAEQPELAMRALTQIVVMGPEHQDQMFALAEMAFLHAERTNDRPYFMAAVVYAYAFLFPGQTVERPNAFDPRLRNAADIYNRALTRAFAADDGLQVNVRGGVFTLPFGSLTINFDPATMQWAGRRITGFVSAAELRVKGLQNRFREPGLGAPLAGELAPVEDERGLRIARVYKVPVTALLKLDMSPAAIASGRFTGTLSLYPGNAERIVEIGGQSVPLEIEPSAALAYGLSNEDIWKSEIGGFLRGDYFASMPSQLVGLEPYRPGRIPVVLVHGTASSAGRWGDMINDLQNDPAIRDRFQFWLFTYSTGNPISISAMQLRDQIEAAVGTVDPMRRDPALRNIVLIGHSQGGLLAKTVVVNSGSALFDQVSTRPLDDLVLSPETREAFRRALFVTPMQDVRRVVFIATPHRGSFVAGFSVAHWVGRLVTLPLNLTKMLGEALIGNQDGLRVAPDQLRIGSVYGMTPGSPFITGLSSLRVAPPVKAHSIIAVDGDGPVATGDDGVVEYSSAHIEEAESELVVRSGHSVQSNPRAVAEVRRILMLHWAEACPEGCSADGAVSVAAAPPKRRPASVRR